MSPRSLVPALAIWLAVSPAQAAEAPDPVPPAEAEATAEEPTAEEPTAEEAAPPEESPPGEGPVAEITMAYLVPGFAKKIRPVFEKRGARDKQALLAARRRSAS